MASGVDAFAELQDVLLAGEDPEVGLSASVEVRDVSYVLPGQGKKAPPRAVLSEVSCKFPTGKLSAIMGASGSGKTSLLTLLRGLRAPGSTVVGEVRCNGRRVETEFMRSLASVVPQEDVFLGALTVREMLSFAAELRLPPKLTSRDRAKKVDLLLSVLKLESCADSAIGDERTGVRGISGGERRRLSVGMSIIGGLPQLLLCDEPTSGLDSAAAWTMVCLLKSLAGRGVTVVCAIHQPSFAIFQEFSSLLLLEAGRTMYSGPVSSQGVGAEGVESYFARLGSPCPQHTNPAYHYLQEIQDRKDFWSGSWAAQAAAAQTKSSPSGTPKSGRRSPVPRPLKPTRSRLSAWDQTKILTRRALVDNFKDKKKFFRGVMSRLPPSIMTGLFFWRIAAVASQESIYPVKGIIFIAVQNPLIETFYAGATTFQLTKGLLKREYYDGLYQVMPFYVSYYVGFLAMQIPWTICWVLPLYLLVGLPLEAARFFTFFFTSFLVILCACAAGSMVGTWTKDANGNRAVLMPLLIPMVLLSGYVIPLAQIPTAWRPIFYLSPMQWAVSLLETSLYQGREFLDCDGSVPYEERRCYATGDELLDATTSEFAQLLGVRGMLLLYMGYIALFVFLNVRCIRSKVLDGRV